MGKYTFTENDRFALKVTFGVNLVLLILSLLYTFDMNANIRPSYIEVEFGEFKTGQLAQYSEVQNEEVAQRPNPSETEPDDPVEEVPEPDVTPQTPTEEDTKPVDLADQLEEVVEEEIKTPETDKIDPTQQETEPQEEKVEIPPVAQENETTTEGAKESGDEDGAVGDVNSDQGIGNDEDKTSPYDLKWEGDLDRAPMVQPLPENSANIQAVITVRFEVRPNGTVGRIIPVKKMNPELEREVMTTLRSWRFSQLPSGAPQQVQWGTITFRFVFD